MGVSLCNAQCMHRTHSIYIKGEKGLSAFCLLFITGLNWFMCRYGQSKMPQLARKESNIPMLKRIAEVLLFNLYTVIGPEVGSVSFYSL